MSMTQRSSHSASAANSCSGLLQARWRGLDSWRTGNQLACGLSVPTQRSHAWRARTDQRGERVGKLAFLPRFASLLSCHEVATLRDDLLQTAVRLHKRTKAKSQRLTQGGEKWRNESDK